MTTTEPGSSAKMALFAKLTTHPGRREDLIAAFDDMFAQVASEPGTELYTLHRDLGEEDAVWMYELYTDAGAATAHGQSEAMRRATGEWGELLAAPPEIVFAAPVRAKGLAL